MLLIDQYAYINRLQGTHPAEKMIFSMLLLFFSLIVRDVFISLIVFVIMSVIIMTIAKIPWSFYLKLLLLPTFFISMSLFTIVFSIARVDETLPAYYTNITIGQWQLFIGKESVQNALQLFFVALGSISCLYFLILTTSIQSICHILRKCKVPSLFVELCELTYRFIFVFLQSTEQIYIAQQSRLGYHSRVQQLRSVSLLITSLFIDVWQRSRQLTIAMQARAVDTNPLYWDDNYQYSKKNWGHISIIFLIIVSIYILKEVL